MSSRFDKLSALLAVDPGDPFVLYGLAQEHAKVGTAEHHAQAVGFYDRCIAADAAYLYAYYHKGMSLIALERTDEAAATLRAGLSAANRAGDQKAIGELGSLLDQIT